MSTATFPRFVVALALLASPAAHAQLAAASAQSPSTPGLPAGFYLEDAVDASFVQPVAVAFAPGGRMFVVEKRGYVWTVQNGVLQSEPFIDLRDEVLNQHDRGLLGIAVDPDFAQNRRVYLSYTVDHEETSDRQRLDAYARIESYAGRADNPNVADLSSRRILIGETFETGIASCYRSHTIGTLAFGADGTLIVGSGDGANYTRTDPGGQYDECFGPGRLDESEDIGAFRSQRVESLAGKMLRIDPVTGEGLPSNPFWTGDGRDNASKVWVLGLRNPFRFSLDPASGASDPSAGRPGRLYIGDVGWSVWEEINVAEGGENYGWPCWEGPALHGSYPDLSPATNSCADDNAGALAAPSYYWHHSRSNRSVPSGRTARAIVSGDVYRGQKYPAYYRGALFYGDYTRGWMAASQLGGAGQPTQERTFSTDIGPIVAYVYDAASEYLHLVNVFSGRIQRLRHTDEAANAAPVAQASATPAQGGAGLRVQFSPAGSFDPDGDALSYTWAFGDGATSDARAPVHAYPSPGVYTAELAASDGVLVTRAEVAVTVRTGAAPTIQITAPRATTRGTTGQAIQLAASVSDPDQSNGTLFVRWTVTQIHDDHVHLDVFTGADPETEFVIPEHGLPGEQVYYRIRAEVRDATGLTAIDEVPLFLASDVGETDVSAEGTIIASVLSPAGGRGSRDPEVIRDGVEPSPGASDTGRQFATYTGARDQDEDWIGYAFAESKRLARVSFQEGLHQADGGWFERPPRVQVRRGGTWRDVVGLEISPAYRADDGRGYDTYDLRFAPAEGDAIRIAGPPAGDNGYISVAELRVFEVSGEGGSADVPAPWTSADVGAPAGAGSAGVIGDVFSVTGGGDIWNQTDGFHFVHQPFDGDGSITAQIVSLTPGTEWFKAGVMIRSSLDADAPHASLLVSNIGAHAQARVSAGGVSTAHGDAWGRTAPGWIRLERSGSSVTAFLSSDGVSWSVLGSVTVPDLAGPALVGLAVSAADFGAGTTATAQFRDVSVTTSTPDEWSAFDVGTPAAAGSTTASGDSFVLTGSGDIWSQEDRFHLASRELPADGAIVARVQIPDGSQEWSKSGLMVRRSAAPGSAHAWFGFSRIGLHLQYRPNTSESSTTPYDDWGARTAEWLRLERSGTTVAAFRSPDGATWTPVRSVTVPGLGSGPVLVGLAVSAADFGNGLTATGEFTSVLVIEADGAVSGGTASLEMDRQQVEAAGFAIDAVYPNPLRGRAAVLAQVPEDAEVTLALYDVLGRQLAQETVQVAAGVRDLALDLRDVPAGAYLLVLRNETTGESETRSVTVVR